MARLSYAQLEGVWIAAGGQKSLAPLMAAIAEAESGGNPQALNPTDNNGRQSSYGLWQISNGTHMPPAADWASPIGNARLAVAKLKSQGLGAWGTYSSGAYKAFYSPGTTPAQYSGTGITTTGKANASAASTSSPKDCILYFPGIPVIGAGFCIFSKGNARALTGGMILAGGVVVGAAGLGVLIAAGLGKTGAGQAVATFLLPEESAAAGMAKRAATPRAAPKTPPAPKPPKPPAPAPSPPPRRPPPSSSSGVPSPQQRQAPKPRRRMVYKNGKLVEA